MVSSVYIHERAAELSIEPSGLASLVVPAFVSLERASLTQVPSARHTWKTRLLFATICGRCATLLRDQSAERARCIQFCTHGRHSRFGLSTITRALRISRSHSNPEPKEAIRI